MIDLPWMNWEFWILYHVFEVKSVTWQGEFAAIWRKNMFFPFDCNLRVEKISNFNKMVYVFSVCKKMSVTLLQTHTVVSTSFQRGIHVVWFLEKTLLEGNILLTTCNISCNAVYYCMLLPLELIPFLSLSRKFFSLFHCWKCTSGGNLSNI